MSVGTLRAAAVAAAASGLVVALAFTTGGVAPADRLPRVAEDGALAEYVARPDPSYEWSLRHEGRVAGAPFVELRLTSQVWRGHEWRHELFVIWPRNMREDAEHALLFIHGGRWRPELEDPGHRGRIPQAALFAMAAEALRAPVAVLRHVPFQPLFGGLTEDALIAYTFDRYLEEREADWPLLLPMVKSAVRAMDAVTEATEEMRGPRIRRFTVTGGSKRGWTAWLTGAIDERVAAVAPISIDVLNMEAHLEHQRRAWGTFSPQIADYIGRGLHEHVDTEAGRALLDVVDPFRYRNGLTQPKLVIVGTNDAYWPADALNLYWDELQGPRWVLYVPNEGHGASDPERVVSGIVSLARHASGEAELPAPEWSFEEEGGTLRLRVEPGPEAWSVRAWVATAPTRDFRNVEWSERSCAEEGDRHLCELTVPADGYGALFAEIDYPGPGPVPLRLSTQMRVGVGSAMGRGGGGEVP